MKQFNPHPKDKPSIRNEDHAEALRFYKSKAWRQLREIKLRTDPLCNVCHKAANEVHHIQDRRDNPDLALDFDNLESLCTSCHTRKTFALYKTSGQTLVLTGKQARSQIKDLSSMGDLIFDWDALGMAIGHPSAPRTKEVNDLLTEWRSELCRRIRSNRVRTRCLILIDDESQARLIARDLKAKLLSCSPLGCKEIN